MLPNRGPTIAGVTYALVIISSIATALRIYCRAWVIKAFAADDWLAVIAQGLFIVFCAYEISGVRYGTGQHFANIPTENYPRAMQMWWTCEPLYVLTNMAIKASIGIFLLRICVVKLHKVIIWTVLVVTEIYSLFFFLLFVLQCQPTSYFWNRYKPNAPSGKCIEGIIVSNSFYGYSAISCWTDWTFSILPIFMVWNLQMNSRTKMSVCIILAAGALASSATIVRFPYLHYLTDVNDFLYSTSDVAIWSTVETGIGITASAVATLRPLLRSFFGGSSVVQSGSTRQWQITGGTTRRYLRSDDNGKVEAFDLHDNPGKTGITTVIDHGGNQEDLEQGSYKRDNKSEVSVGSNNSQSNLAKKSNEQTGGQSWDVTIRKTIIQTHG